MTERRYQPIVKLAAGGMATVFLGTARGALGFRQLVALKRPHPHLLEDPTYRRELVAEARLASLIHHANVVDVRDVEIEGDEITLVMDYVEGVSLADLLGVAARGGAKVPAPVAVRIVIDACAGLHAAHELVDEKGRAVGLVHRDVSPQNLLVGVDGTTRVADFGVAKATAGRGSTNEALKGKLAYMAPEYVRNEPIDRRVDVFGLGVVLWEALTYERLFRGEHDADTLRRVLEREAPRISERAPTLGTSLDAVVSMALAKDPSARFQTALAFGNALERAAAAAMRIATSNEVADLVRQLAGHELDARREIVRKKLADEPSLLSFMNGEAPSEVAALPTRQLAVTVAPPTKPMANTLPIDPVAPAAPAHGSTLPLPPRPSTPSAMPVAPQEPPPARRSAAIVIAALGVLLLVGGGAAYALTRRTDVPAPIASVAPPRGRESAPEVEAPLAALSSATSAPLAHAASTAPSTATPIKVPTATSSSTAPVPDVADAGPRRRRHLNHPRGGSDAPP